MATCTSQQPGQLTCTACLKAIDEPLNVNSKKGGKRRRASVEVVCTTCKLPSVKKQKSDKSEDPHFSSQSTMDCEASPSQQIEAKIDSEIDKLHVFLDVRKSELKTELKDITGKENGEDIAFTMLADVAQVCKLVGVLHSTTISSKMSFATGKGLEVAERGKKATAIVHICDEKGRVYPKPIESLSCELTSGTNPDKIKGTVKKTKDGRFNKIIYHPTSRGRHQLHIKVEGEHIKGSPFEVIVKLPVQELGIPVRTINGVNGARGVAINQQGEIVVAEDNGDRVSIFASPGEKISFGVSGRGHGQLSSPIGVTVDGDGNILVADYWNNRIQKFTSGGRFIAAVGEEGSGPLQFKYPTGIKVNAQSKKIYVVEYKNHRIQVLQPDLSFFCSFGSRGGGPGQLNNPYDVAFDSDNNVYVTDKGNNRIQVFSANGTFLRQIGKQGNGKCELGAPAMIAIDDEDRIFVTGTTKRQVSVFTIRGDRIHIISQGLQGTLGGIAVDRLGMVYVCENDRVLIL